jgi:hypothetical protein
MYPKFLTTSGCKKKGFWIKFSIPKYMRFLIHGFLMMGIGILFGISGIKAQDFERSVAILEIHNEQTGNPDPTKILSVRYMAEVAGVSIH